MSTTNTSISGPGLDNANVDPHAVTISGIVLDPVYTQDTPTESLQHIDRDIAAPGDFPYTRGLFPQGYRSRLDESRACRACGSVPKRARS